jgi:hypothetical protein
MHQGTNFLQKDKAVSTQFLNALLSHLEENRCFPRYQYERRIDAFISFFLPAVLKSRFGTDIKIRIPEFPVKTAHAHRLLCENIDYLMFDTERAALFLVELKTDAGSVRPAQLSYYNRVLTESWDVLRADVEKLRNGSGHKEKYDAVLRQMECCIDIRERRAIFLAPETARGKFQKVLSLQNAQLQEEGKSICESWEFLSLNDFADTPLQTEYKAEWQVVAEHLKGICK